MKHLLPYSDKIKGCELIFPDTVFFENGEPLLLIKTDPKDFCLLSVKGSQKLSFSNLLKDFQNLTRERKKDSVGIFRKRFGYEFH